MKKHLERQSKDAYEVNQENGEWFPVFGKTKTIDEIIKEKRSKEMRTYTEEDLRILASLIDDAYRPYTSNNVEGQDVVENFIKGIIPKTEENKIPMTYGFLRSRISWETFCDITGIDYYATREGYEIKDDEIFYLTESQVKGLI